MPEWLASPYPRGTAISLDVLLIWHTQTALGSVQMMPRRRSCQETKKSVLWLSLAQALRNGILGSRAAGGGTHFVDPAIMIGL